MRRIGGERRWWKVLVPALPGLATDIGQRLAEHRALEWGNEMIGEYAGPYLKPALLWLWQNPMYWTLAPPVMYLLWVNRRLSEQDMMDEDRERITAGWLSRELETRGYDPKQLAYVADSCVARLETHHLDTKAAARRLFDDARTRADVERLYLQELPRTRNETNVRDALGLCAWGPPIHRAS